MPGRLLVRDTTPTGQVAMVRTIVLESCRCRHRTARERARSSRMRSRQVEGGIRLDRLVFDEGGRETQLKLHTQPTAGGRTLVDADRIKAARIGDPLDVDLTERACRPLIRLSTHPTAAARAVRVSEPRPSTSSLLSVPCRDVDPVPTPDHPRTRASSRVRSAAGVGAPGCGVVVDEGGHGSATHVSASWCSLLLTPTLVWVVFPIGQGPPEASVHNYSNCFHDVRAGAPPSAAW
ncbi:hypothetical protein EVAR_19269_1 [Eumeta japonica]|uniref:Uncharacterized protein n=1 Tax=Eumeta variegata TaxID=151549 RepID=A0A4C1UEN5_EUMVA|nr:hypothetical protein EVAR_19269_1 [Eumeta japonica]